MNEWQRGSARRGKVNVGLIILLAVLVVGAVGYWVWVARDNAVPAAKPPDEVTVRLYHARTGKAMQVKGTELASLAERDGLYEYPPGSGKFEWRRSRAGGARVIDRP